MALNSESDMRAVKAEDKDASVLRASPILIGSLFFIFIITGLWLRMGASVGPISSSSCLGARARSCYKLFSLPFDG